MAQSVSASSEKEAELPKGFGLDAAASAGLTKSKELTDFLCLLIGCGHTSDSAHLDMLAKAGKFFRKVSWNSIMDHARLSETTNEMAPMFKVTSWFPPAEFLHPSSRGSGKFSADFSRKTLLEQLESETKSFNIWFEFLSVTIMTVHRA